MLSHSDFFKFRAVFRHTVNGISVDCTVSHVRLDFGENEPELPTICDDKFLTHLSPGARLRAGGGRHRCVVERSDRTVPQILTGP